MNAEWQDRINGAQAMTALRIQGYDRPEIRHRVRCGQEKHRIHPIEGSCWDCAAAPGQLHVPGCDQEECPGCGGQLLSCSWHGCPWGDAERVTIEVGP